MQPQRFINTYQDDSVLSAWREGIAEASKSPDLKHQLRQRESELLPRFAEHYSKLKALPRRVRRGLQRQWKKSLAGIALLLALGAQPALAATINVGGTCTLIRAINAANKDTTAGGGCTQGAGADRIVLPASSTVTLRTVNNASLGATGLPIIDSVITIAGNNSAIRRAASAPDFQIFAVAESGDLRLQRTTVNGGSSGIVNQGSTTVNNSTISGNTRVGVDSYYALSLTINNSVISRNGSGIFCRGGYTSCVVTNSVISPIEL